jgi:cellulose synthase/poly-beta-1,6-N-acetylglucosamine synthase-like glycosyltransferase
MMTIRRTFALLAGALTLSLVLPVTPASGADDDLYARMQRVNSGLQSYQADVTLAIQMHSFPFLSPTLEGKAYFKRPDKTAVQFQTVPALAGQLKKLVGQMEAPSEWPRLYDVTPVNDDGTVAVFRLVRKKNGRIDHVDVKVDDKTATVSEMTYSYKDSGGTTKFDNTYDQIAGNFVLKQQTGKVDIPHYNADVNATYDHYKINVPVDDKVFQDS